jgi:hypothetical protein
MAGRSSGGTPPAGGEPEPEVWSPLTAGESPTGAADPRLKSRPFALNEHMHRARFTLVRRLLWLLSAVLGTGVAMLVTTRWTRLTADDVSDFVTMVFGAVLSLVGASVGFYFGGDRGRE